jgi:hypothetical protein
VFGEAINIPGDVNIRVLPDLVINEIDYVIIDTVNYEGDSGAPCLPPARSMWRWTPI